MLYKEQKFEEAIRCYEQAIEVCPNERKEDIAIFHQNIAAVYEAMVTMQPNCDVLFCVFVPGCLHIEILPHFLILCSSCMCVCVCSQAARASDESDKVCVCVEV